MRLKTKIMREIKFRGQKIDTKEWVYGYLVKDEGGHCYIFNYWFIPAISIPSEKFIEVVPESVGEYTIIKDKNGVEVYEGDIDNKSRVCEYFPKLGSYVFKNPKYTIVTFLGQFLERENYIIGNIHENPELLTN